MHSAGVLNLRDNTLQAPQNPLSLDWKRFTRFNSSSKIKQKMTSSSNVTLSRLGNPNLRVMTRVKYLELFRNKNQRLPPDYVAYGLLLPLSVRFY